MATPDSNPFDTQTAIDAVEAAARHVGQFAAATFHGYTFGFGQCMRPPLESPIEAVFWVWWEALEVMDRVERGESRPSMFNYYLTRQLEIKVSAGATFRADFAVEELSIAIELDGHDFHERTKQQVTYRNRRDRELQADGWTVLHISGSELVRDPLDTVRSVYLLCADRAISRIAASLPVPTTKAAQ